MNISICYCTQRQKQIRNITISSHFCQASPLLGNQVLLSLLWGLAQLHLHPWHCPQRDSWYKHHPLKTQQTQTMIMIQEPLRDIKIKLKMTVLLEGMPAVQEKRASALIQ